MRKLLNTTKKLLIRLECQGDSYMIGFYNQVDLMHYTLSLCNDLIKHPDYINDNRIMEIEFNLVIVNAWLNWQLSQ